MVQLSKSVFGVRSAVRALIVRNGHLLAIQMRRPGGDLFHILPGGGQSHGETLEQSLKRECLEEIGVEPTVGSLAYVREYIGKHHLFSVHHRDFHQLEVVFHCSLEPSAEIGPGHETDRHQVGYDWLPLEKLGPARFYPQVLTNYVRNGTIDIHSVYLGDVN